MEHEKEIVVSPKSNERNVHVNEILVTYIYISFFKLKNKTLTTICLVHLKLFEGRRIFSLCFLGWFVLKKAKQIVQEVMQRVGAQSW